MMPDTLFAKAINTNRNDFNSNSPVSNFFCTLLDFNK